MREIALFLKYNFKDFDALLTRKPTEVSDSDFDEPETCCNLDEKKTYVFLHMHF